MRSFACAWILALSLFGGGTPLPETGNLFDVEEQEALRHPERDLWVRKKTDPAPVPLRPRLAPSPGRPSFHAPALPDEALWIARTHERSPTA